MNLLAQSGIPSQLFGGEAIDDMTKLVPFPDARNGAWKRKASGGSGNYVADRLYVNPASGASTIILGRDLY